MFLFSEDDDEGGEKERHENVIQLRFSLFELSWRAIGNDEREENVIKFL